MTKPLPNPIALKGMTFPILEFLEPLQRTLALKREKALAAARTQMFKV